VNKLLKSIGAIQAGGFVIFFLDVLHSCQEKNHAEAVLHPGSDTAHGRQCPGEIAQPTDRENIQANLAEKYVDGSKGRVEHPTPDDTDDNHADDLGQKKCGTEEGKSGNGAATQERGQKEPYQDWDDAEENNKNQVVAQGIVKFGISKKLNIVGKTDPGSILAETIPLVETAANGFENGQKSKEEIH